MLYFVVGDVGWCVFLLGGDDLGDVVDDVLDVLFVCYVDDELWVCVGYCWDEVDGVVVFGMYDVD